MTISYNWLKEYVDFDLDPKTLESKTSLQGVEVESVTKYGGVIDGLVIGQIVNIEKHPNADKLSLCKVDVGENDPLQIICGAPNVWDKPNPKVIVATEGCYLPAIDIKIKKAKMRGVESRGMILSEEELGIAEKSEGIWLLPDNASVGEYPSKYLPKEDYIIEIAPTANRGDLLGIIGFAREVAAMTGSKVNYPETRFDADDTMELPNITIQDPDLCYRFSSRIIKGIHVGESPKWLKDKLKSVGQRPINNIVDISNYVMFELGHPNHVYDLNKLGNRQIIVRRAKENEIIVTLDDEKRKLNPDMLVIADNTHPVGVAGVMGSESSEVSANTIDVLLEAAYFQPHSVRKTAKTLGMSTDASYRFERTVDINTTVTAVDRLTDLIIDICGGTPSEMVDEYPNKKSNLEIDFKLSYLEKMVGHNIPKDRTIQILKSLEFIVENKDSDTLHLTVPSYKTDVERPIDVVEEVARVYGFNNIPDTIYPISINNEILSTKAHTVDRVRDMLVGYGLTEFMNFSFSQHKDMSALNMNIDDCVKVVNPLSQDQELLRTSLLPNLVQNCVFNISHGNKDIQAFEVGKIYEADSNTDTGYRERTMLGVVLFGDMEEKDIYGENRTADFYDMKGIIEELTKNLDIYNVEFTREEDSKYLHNGMSAAITLKGKKIGSFGVVHPSVAKEYKLTQNLILCEIDIDTFDETNIPERAFIEISKFPAVYRDANFEVSSDVEYKAIEKAIRNGGGKILTDFKLVDIYIDDKLKSENKKSMTYEFKFQDMKKTLDDKTIDKTMNKIIKKVTGSTGGTLRGA